MGREGILAVLREYKQAFAEKYGILEIGVFGSVARDEATPESDVDICIKTTTPDPFVLVHIKEDLETRGPKTRRYSSRARKDESIFKESPGKKGALCLTRRWF